MKLETGPTLQVCGGNKKQDLFGLGQDEDPQVWDGNEGLKKVKWDRVRNGGSTETS